MKKTLWAMSICAGLLLAASAPAWAHHAFQAEFDQRKPIKLEGKLRTWSGSTRMPGSTSM